MSAPLLTVIFTHGGTPTSVKVDVVHPPIEVVHGVRVSPSPIRARGSGIPFASLALSIFLKALRSLLLFLTDPMFLVFLPTDPSGGHVRKRKVEQRQDHRPISQCPVISRTPSVPRSIELLIDWFPPLSEITGQRVGQQTALAG